jgi:hypothetical protein
LTLTWEVEEVKWIEGKYFRLKTMPESMEGHPAKKEIDSFCVVGKLNFYSAINEISRI